MSENIKKIEICEYCGKEIEVTVPMYILDNEFVCYSCFEKEKENQFLEKNWHIIKKHYPEIEVDLWRKYPQEKPKEEYISQCIVMTVENRIHTSVYWSRIDSQHDDSIWKKVTHYINVEDLRKLLDIIKEKEN